MGSRLVWPYEPWVSEDPWLLLCSKLAGSWLTLVVTPFACKSLVDSCLILWQALASLLLVRRSVAAICIERDCWRSCLSPRPCWASEEERAELLWRGGQKRGARAEKRKRERERGQSGFYSPCSHQGVKSGGLWEVEFYCSLSEFLRVSDSGQVSH